MTAHPRASLITAFALMFLALAPPALFGTLGAEMMTELDIDDAQFGALTTAFWATTGILAVFSGRLADRLGWRRAAVLGSVLMSATLVGVAAVASAWLGLLVGAVVAGVAYGFCSPTSNVIVVQEIAPSWRARAFSIKQTAPTVVVIVAGAAMSLVADPLGWRWAFPIPALATVAVLALLWITARTPQDRVMAATAAAATAPTGTQGSPALLLVGAAMGSFAMASLTTFSVIRLVQVGITTGVAGVVMTSAGLAALGVRLGVGWYLDRSGADITRTAMALCCLSAMATAGMAVSNPAAVAVAAVVGMASMLGWPPLLLQHFVQSRPTRAAHAAGLMQIGSGLAAAVGPISFGVASTQVGAPMAWIGLGILVLSGSLLPLARYARS